MCVRCAETNLEVDKVITTRKSSDDAEFLITFAKKEWKVYPQDADVYFL